MICYFPLNKMWGGKINNPRDTYHWCKHVIHIIINTSKRNSWAVFIPLSRVIENYIHDYLIKKMSTKKLKNKSYFKSNHGIVSFFHLNSTFMCFSNEKLEFIYSILATVSYASRRISYHWWKVIDCWVSPKVHPGQKKSSSWSDLIEKRVKILKSWYIDFIVFVYS